MKRTLTLLASACLLAFMLGGCGDDTDDGSSSDDNGTTSEDNNNNNSNDNSSNDNGSASDGTTQCGMDGISETCAAGQYCSEPRFAECSNGCLSNSNCSGDQTCSIPSGESVGACENNQTTPDGPTEQAFCEKLTACQVPDNCSQAFAASSVECRECIVEENCTDILDFDGACDSACGF